MTGPTKRSIMIAGHATSISLEPVFWEALKDTAVAEGVPLSALVARLDAARVETDDPPNLASYLRTWLFERAGASPRAAARGEGDHPQGGGGVAGG